MMCEPCMCGDPECGNCFPRYKEEDEDEAYERFRQQEIDDARDRDSRSPG